MSFNLPLYKNFGSEIRELSPTLANQLSQMYSDLASALSQAVKKDVTSGANPAANTQRNAFFSIGDITVRSDTNAVWVLTSRTTAEAVTWTLVS